MNEMKVYKIPGITIKIKKNKNYWKKFLECSFLNYNNIFKFFNDLEIALYQKYRKKQPYRIISLGEYCFSRCIVTYSGLKPQKKDGEKTLPFDLSIHNLESIIYYIDNGFKGFYDGIEYDREQKYWLNNSIKAVYNHEKEFTRTQFIERYQRRISDFYEYLNDKSRHIYFLITELSPAADYYEPVTMEQLERLDYVLKKYRSTDSYDIILLSYREIEGSKDLSANIHIINETENAEAFKKVNKNFDWAGELQRRNTRNAQRVYYSAVHKLLKIIR